jgi:hypothetical protein
LVNLKPKSAGDGYPMKVIEKTVLRFLGSRTFSHGLNPEPTFVVAQRLPQPSMREDHVSRCLVANIYPFDDSGPP